MPSTSRRKRAFVFSSILLILVVAASATVLYIHRKSGSASEVSARSDAKSTGTSGDVALASTKTTGKAATPGKGKEGRVAEVLVEEGNKVGKGQVLAQLVKDDAEIALTKALVRLENSKLNYDRAQQEVAEHLISQEQFDRTHLENQIAQQELAEAQWRLAKTTIRAPFGGRVTERFLKLGQHIRPGDQLFTVADFDPLIAKIFLPEKDVIGLKEGRDVRITMKASEQTRFHGRIRQISPVVDTATGTVKLTVEATAPPPEVRPGAFVTIDIVRETHPQAVLLPREAVIRELQDAYVFVASAGIAEKRTVSLGLEEGTRIEALSGVKPGEQVIVAGQGGLKQGSPIKVIPAPEASDLGGVADRPVRG